MSKKHRKIGQGQIQGHPKVIDPHQVWCHLKGFLKLCLNTKFEVPSILGLEVMQMSNLLKIQTNRQTRQKYNTTLMNARKDKTYIQ